MYWAASDIGWVVGHSYIVYAPLLHGCTTVLYEGKPVGTPDAGAFWRVIAQHGVSALFTAPTAFRAIRREDPDGKFIAQYDLVASSAPCFWPASAPIRRPSTGRERQLRVPVIDHWWQTETGWAISGQLRRARAAAGQARLADQAGAGLRSARARRLTGREMQAAARSARCACKLPLPPGALPTLWNADERFVESYLADYPGYYQHRRRGLSSTRTAMSSS